jgi:hypothetical protein
MVITVGVERCVIREVRGRGMFSTLDDHLEFERSKVAEPGNMDYHPGPGARRVTTRPRYRACSPGPGSYQ